MAGAVFGAGAFPLYAIAVAHANDYADAAQSVEVSSGLLLIYGMGAAVGPLLASLWREILNGPSLFFFTAAVHVVLIGYVIWRMSQRVPAGARSARALRRGGDRRADRAAHRAGGRQRRDGRAGQARSSEAEADAEACTACARA